MAKTNSTACAAALTQNQIKRTPEQHGRTIRRLAYLQEIHPQATVAIRAAQLYPSIGRFAARRYCERHGIPTRLYYLARQLAAVQ